uniref:Uncharacterized protein n=1 Tax=Schistosoma japonicum TaxID=6182 RepID=C1L963_SCHJA|nr:hypothetical protein [Schistosoma japonicum]CAX71248.1 hypothetical protein [Schistosoma japonicum]
MLFNQCYSIVLVFYINFITSVFTYYDDYEYGMTGEAGRDAEVALHYTVGKFDGKKYGENYEYLQDNYGKYGDYDDYGYDSYYGDEGYDYNHVTLADRAMRKLKDMKRRKHHYLSKDYDEGYGYGYGPEVEEYKEPGYNGNNYPGHKPPMLLPPTNKPPSQNQNFRAE